MNKGRIKISFSDMPQGTTGTTWDDYTTYMAEKISTALGEECESIITETCDGFPCCITTLPLPGPNMSDEIKPCLVIRATGAVPTTATGYSLYVGLYNGQKVYCASLFGGPCIGADYYSYKNDVAIYPANAQPAEMWGLCIDTRFSSTNGFIQVGYAYASGTEGYSQTFFVSGRNKKNNKNETMLLRLSDTGYANDTNGSALQAVLVSFEKNSLNTAHIRRCGYNDRGSFILHPLENDLHIADDFYLLTADGENSSLLNYLKLNYTGPIVDNFKDGLIMPDGTHYYIVANVYYRNNFNCTMTMAFKKFD